MVSYEPNPSYPPVGGSVHRGWKQPVDADITLSSERAVVLAIDGPMCAPWKAAIDGLEVTLATADVHVAFIDMRQHFKPWSEVLALTSTPELADDPDFAKLPTAKLADLINVPELPVEPDGVIVVYGPGAALAAHDVLWYADLPKRFAEAAVVSGHGENLGQAADNDLATTKRLFYIDWPLLDQHRDSIADDFDRFFDLQTTTTHDASAPASIVGAVLRRTVDHLAAAPIRTRPTFNTTVWGGTWGQQKLGLSPDASNTGVGYELIAPESGVLVGDPNSAAVELPFQLIVAMHPQRILGPAVHERFGTSFPVRFDYLDTVGGANLSVHCHPQAKYMREVFGWPYTQHETYYLMVGDKKNKVFLGLRKGVDLKAFRRDAHNAQSDGVEFNIEKYIQTFPAKPHKLFVIPAGTPHGSGEGNVVLEVSATPYLYSLRFFDWLRRDSGGMQRPVHVDRAFANLNTGRTGKAVEKELIQNPRKISSGPGWFEEILGARPEMFFQVQRITLGSDTTVVANTIDRFHVLNVAEGEGILLTTNSGFRQRFAYAETFVVPAAVGPYSLTRIGESRVRLVKALVT